MLPLLFVDNTCVSSCGRGSPQMKKRIVAADPHVYKRMLDPAVYPHVAPQVTYTRIL